MVKSSMVASIVGAGECGDCLSQPPPLFVLPPPPRPPYLQELVDCSQAQFIDIKSCNAIPVIDAEYQSSPALPSVALLLVCFVFLFLLILALITLLWKHKKKMENFSGCKSSRGDCGPVREGVTLNRSHANGSVIYEDLTNICPRQTLVVGVDGIKNSPVGIGFDLSLPNCQVRPSSNEYLSEDPYNPIYEQICYGTRGKNKEDDRIRERTLIGEDLRSRSRSRSEGGATSSMRLCVSAHSPYHTDNNIRNPPERRWVGDSGCSNEGTKKICKKRQRGDMTESRGKSKERCGRGENMILEALFNCRPHNTPYTLGSDPTGVTRFSTFRPLHSSNYSHNTFGGRSSDRVSSNHYHLPYSLDLILS